MNMNVWLGILAVVALAHLTHAFTDFDHSSAYDKVMVGRDLDDASQAVRDLCSQQFKPFANVPQLKEFYPTRYTTEGINTLCLPGIFNGTHRFVALGFVKWGGAKSYVTREVLADFEPVYQTDDHGLVLALMMFSPLERQLTGAVDYGQFSISIAMDVKGTGLQVDHAESMDVLATSSTMRFFRLTSITPDSDFASIMNKLYEENWEVGQLHSEIGTTTSILSASYGNAQTPDITLSIYMPDMGSSVDSVRVAQHLLNVIIAMPTISGNTFYNLGTSFYSYMAADWDSDDGITYGTSQRAKRLESLGFRGGIISMSSSYALIPPNAYPLLAGTVPDAPQSLL